MASPVPGRDTGARALLHSNRIRASSRTQEMHEPLTEERIHSETASRTPSSVRTKRDRGRTRKRTVSPRVFWVVVASGILVVSLVAVDAFASAGRIHPGVLVGGVRVGGMTRSQATTALKATLPEKARTPVAVVYRSKTWPVSSEDLDVSFDYASLVDAAMGVGRTAGFAGNMAQRVHAWFDPLALPATATADPTKIDTVLDTIVGTIDQPPRDAKVVADGSSWIVKPSAPGTMVDRPALARGVLTAFTSTDREISAEPVVAQADIGDSAADKAKSAAEAMIAQPAMITWGAKSWKLTVNELRGMISFRKVAGGSSVASWSLEPFVSASEASRTITPRLGANIGHPARDAAFKTRSGEVSILPAQVGMGPDIETLSANLTDALKSPAGQPRVVELHTRKTLPKVTTAMAHAMNIQARISTFTTRYTPSNRPRVNNIHTLGNALDGKLIAPDATFSFNGTVGERTAAKGYKEANAIVDGKLVPQLGGGICQVGTTLFNTVFVSGLPVVERHNHSFYISHYPKGRDATVSWGGPDLKFKNTTGHWLLLSVSYSSSSITMSLYGTDPGYKVTSVTSPFSNERPFQTQTIKDPKLPEGEEVVDDPGETGRTCTVTRTVERGGVVVSTDVFRSVYRPKIEVIRVGTKPMTSKAATGTAGSKN